MDRPEFIIQLEDYYQDKFSIAHALGDSDLICIRMSEQTLWFDEEGLDELISVLDSMKRLVKEEK